MQKETQHFSPKSQQSQRQRSKSTKKGIYVSLTPSKMTNQTQTHSQNKKNLQASQIHSIQHDPFAQIKIKKKNQNQNIKFIYQTPISSQQSQIQNKIKQNDFIQFQNEKNPSQKKQHNLSNKHKNIIISQPIKKNDSIGLNRSHETVQNRQKGQQIRPVVFDIVQQIVSKVYPFSKYEQKKKQFQKQANYKNHQDLLEHFQSEKNFNKSSNEEKFSKESHENRLQTIAERTLQASGQLKGKNQNLRMEEKVLKCNNQLTNGICKEFYKQGQIKRYERLKKAQQKLLRIIQVCQFGI